jgi:hypothetical protein
MSNHWNTAFWRADNSAADASDKVVNAYLADRVRGPDDPQYPSQTWVDLDDICTDTDLNVKCVKEALKRLQAAGFIQRKRRFNASTVTTMTVRVLAAGAADDRRVRGRRTPVYEQPSQWAVREQAACDVLPAEGAHVQPAQALPNLQDPALIPHKEDDDFYGRMARRMTGRKVSSGTDF